MNITRVLPDEIDEIMRLIQAAIDRMESEGNYQWDSRYPDRNVILNDIFTGNLYALKLPFTTAGIIVLNETQAPEYDNIAWADKQGRPLIVHRLCVHPQYQRRGLARQLMTFAEHFAQENHFSSIRLDAYTQNRKALGLYDNLGYLRRGLVRFRGKGEFCCFEKLITTGF